MAITEESNLAKQLTLSALLEQLRVANNVVANTNDAVVIADADYRIVDANPATVRLSGFPREELIGAATSILGSDKDGSEHLTEMQEALSQSGRWDGEACNQTKTGDLYTTRLRVSAIKNEEEELTNYVFIFHDISYIKKHEEELKKIAFSDALTGLPNRMVLHDRLKQALLQFSRSANNLAVCYIDLDNFKKINDNYGHDIGDKVLIEVSERIKSATRSNDTAARIGDDEFIILLQNIGSASQVQNTVERILDTITSLPYSTPYSEITVSVGIGVALPHESDIDAETLLQNAGKAMVSAKAAGTNNYHIFSEEHLNTVLRILVVDDSFDYRALVSSMLRSIYPNAIVDLHDPNVWDIDAPEIKWANYDILLLDYLLGEGNGIDWFNERKSMDGFPATILMSGTSTDEQIINKATKSGIASFLQKRATTTKELREVIDNTRESYFSDGAMPGDVQSIKQHDDKYINGKSIFGSYIMGGQIGKGATANAYVAKGQDGKDVAIKIFEIKKEHSPNALQRFLEENRLLKKIDHPNVIRVIDFGGDDIFAYIVLEYMPGGTLQDRLDKGVTCKEAIGYTMQIARGLQSLHEAGIMHRDIKPHNILFGKNDSLVITDLGAAKAVDRQVNLTKAGDAIGTPLYISPEQILNKKLDPRSDIYNLGVLLYEMVSGEHPFRVKGKDVIELLHKHVYSEVEPISGKSDRLNNVIRTMVAKNPNNRYQNVSTLLQDLDDAVDLCKDS